MKKKKNIYNIYLNLYLLYLYLNIFLKYFWEILNFLFYIIYLLLLFNIFFFFFFNIDINILRKNIIFLKII